LKSRFFYVTLDFINWKRGKKHGNSTQAQCVFRQTRIRAVRRRCVGRVGKHLALPVSGRKIRRRHFSAHLHPAGCHLWLHHDHCRNGAGPDDPQKPGGRLQPFWQGEGAGVRRLDQRRHPHPDRSLLFGHRRMGHPLSGPVSHRPRQRAGIGRVFLRLHLQRSAGRDRIPAVHLYHAGHHLCGRAQRRGARFQGDDAGAGGALGGHCRLLGHTARRTGRCKVFSGAQPGQLLMDDRGFRHGADVLLPLHCHGHPGDLWLLHEKERVH